MFSDSAGVCVGFSCGLGLSGGVGGLISRFATCTTSNSQASRGIAESTRGVTEPPSYFYGYAPEPTWSHSPAAATLARHLSGPARRALPGSLFEPPGSPCGALVLTLVWDLPDLPALLEARVQRISAHREWAAAPGAQLLPICLRR